VNKELLFNKIRDDLKDRLHFLDDKPEETLESTLIALWFFAAGFPVSAEKAVSLTLPVLKEEQLKTLYVLIDNRLNNIPLAHITKRQSFMGIELISDNRALIPRKETEILGKKALELSFEISKPKAEINVIDVCCGSGNLGIAISYFNQKCKVYATDISNEAVELTLENISLLNLNGRVFAKHGDLFSGFESEEFYEKIDLIVCNPPYITSSKVIKMNSEIAANEPVLAFDGGMLGIKIIQQLISEAPRFLKPESWLIFEVGVGQGDFISKLIEKTNKYQKMESLTDDSGNIRVLLAQKSASLN
jgi:release factor glutamine methyltransferase